MEDRLADKSTLLAVRKPVLLLIIKEPVVLGSSSASEENLNDRMTVNSNQAL